MAAANKLKEGRKFLKEAEKLCAPSLLQLRFKPDWSQACPLFERAAASFRAAQAWDSAISALERVALAQERQGSPWHAAKALESGAACAKEKGDSNSVARLSREAAEYYFQAGRPVASGEALMKGAKLIEDQDQALSLSLAFEAMETLEQHKDGGPRNPDLYRDAINMAVRTRRWDKAVGALMKFGLECSSTNALGSMAKAYLGAVVVQLYAEQPEEAWLTFQDVLAVDSFAVSDSAHAADRLFEAYRTGDPDKVRASVKESRVFQHGLDNSIARLAKQLPQGNLQKQAELLGRSMQNSGGGGGEPEEDEIDEDDLT
uniref:Gamma-soluble NSF attachment protein n=1 Tax=Tetraselmis sp. GSL018 TaxID=582737 RepID=A0A061SDW2_9CHLO|mmetsp:Transcript_18468/g.44117  ORF Transcript_18468/g.44117 Transcript_18468/m.44117 type:complete len:317 (+) Transcript_18468:243-1193(+)